MVFGIYILLVWTKGNIKFKQMSPVINVSKTDEGITPSTKKSSSGQTGPIEVNVDKKMIVDTKSDEVSVKLDEKIKGKVKTQKDKLKKLRG
jgi:hypothetical protein